MFEEIVEGRATRFAAVFHSQESNPVGPIRSGRTQDIDLLGDLNEPLFVWSGGNAGVTERSAGDRLDAARPGQPPGFFRDGGRPRAAQPVRQHDRAVVAGRRTPGDAVPIFEYGAAEPAARR